MVRELKLKKIEPTESEVLNAVCEYLSAKNYFFFRVNNVPVFQGDGHGGGFFRKLSKWSIAGVPDIIMIYNGDFIGLEIKTPSGRQSPEQKAFETRCKNESGEYYIIRRIEDLIEIGL